MKIGEAGDSLSLARVILAMAVGAIVFGVAGTLFDRFVGPYIAMNGWWTVFAAGGLILGGMVQAAREWAVPRPAERRAVAARVRAREAAEAEAAAKNAEQPRPEKPAEE
jgi:small-conductance mechanosensitive channel